MLGIYYHITYVGNMFNQLFCLKGIMFFLEIGTDSAFEVFSFTYIDNLAIGIEMLIDSGFLR